MIWLKKFDEIRNRINRASTLPTVFVEEIKVNEFSVIFDFSGDVHYVLSTRRNADEARSLSLHAVKTTLLKLNIKNFSVKLL